MKLKVRVSLHDENGSLVWEGQNKVLDDEHTITVSGVQDATVLRGRVTDALHDDPFGSERGNAQMDRNVQWLLEQIDKIHTALCPEQRGTWQQRAQFAVAAAQALVEAPTGHTVAHDREL